MHYCSVRWILFSSIICLAAAVSPYYNVIEKGDYSAAYNKSGNNIVSLNEESRQLFKPGVRNQRAPCSCADGQCGCCTGYIFEQLNVNIRQRGCVNITYIPEDYAFNLTMRFNERVIYMNTVSARNPKPVCLPLYLIPGNMFKDTEFCVRIYDIQNLESRNIFWCLRVYFRMPGWPNGGPGLTGETCYSFGLDGYVVNPSTTRRPISIPSETSSSSDSSELTSSPPVTSAPSISSSNFSELESIPAETPSVPSTVSSSSSPELAAEPNETLSAPSISYPSSPEPATGLTGTSLEPSIASFSTTEPAANPIETSSVPSISFHSSPKPTSIPTETSSRLSTSSSSSSQEPIGNSVETSSRPSVSFSSSSRPASIPTETS